MYSHFLRFAEEQALYGAASKIILAVSGGIDSMVMLDLYGRSDLQFVVAHCNFGLRGHDAMLDTKLVEQHCQAKGYKCYVEYFDTAAYAKEHKISIQVAARELRYNWFEELRLQLAFDFIATAHHQGDTIETFFINLIRGTGIRGLTGIKAKRENIIRPLLYADRGQIADYAKIRPVEYREDASNKSLKYLRNKLRHSILPSIEAIMGNYKNTMLENMDRLRDIELVYHNAIEQVRSQTVVADEHRVQIDISKLRKLNPLHTYLYEFLRPYGFNADAARSIAASLDRQAGQQFLSPTHRLIKGRNMLIIQPIETKPIGKDTEYWLYDSDEYLNICQNKVDALQMSISWPQQHIINRSKATAALDAGKLQFPLLLRKWQRGDWFCPQGMDGKRKKISNLFGDLKMNIAHKEQQWLLCNQSDIVWVIGQRIDERYKITEQTDKIIQLEILNN